jgi:hypothetical protein
MNMLTRSSLAIGAAFLAGLAGVVASQDGDADIVPFFFGLTVLGGVGAWALHEPYGGRRRLLARGIGVTWLGAAGWIGALLLWQQAVCGCSFPAPIAPEETYLGLTATIYHLAGVYLGGALMAVAAFSRRLEAA